MTKRTIIDESYKADFEFEMSFYDYLAGTQKYEILSIPDVEGYIPTTEEFHLFHNEFISNNSKILYKINCGSYYLMYSIDLEKVGILPIDDSHGFSC